MPVSQVCYYRKKHANIAGAGSLASIVSQGKGGMPAFGRKLTRTEIRQVVDYVMKFRSKKPAP